MDIDWSVESMIIGVIASQITIIPIVYATRWVYLGTSGVNNGSYDAGINYSSTCKTQGAVTTIFTNAIPATVYAVGFIMRVSHWRDPSDGMLDPLPCTSYYFQAQ
jgi:hypothetical protein